jgi:phosphate:Na+ symporter
VLLIMSLAYAQFVTPASALALVLGANLGSAINPVLEGARRADPASYRVPAGNLANRVVGTLVALPLIPWLAPALQTFQPDSARMTAEFHIAFNVVMALVFLPLLGPAARLLTRALPAAQRDNDPGAPRYLDDGALATPSLALADAARETLRMGDMIETMLRKIMVALTANDRGLAAEVSHMDDAVDRLDEAIKLYITQLTRGALDEREARRAMEIISFSINLEHVGDIIDKNLAELAMKKIKRKLQFSAEGAAELNEFHRRIVESLRIAFSVFMSGDPREARRLIAEKTALRTSELAAAEHHIERLREGRRETLETTSLHLDVLRDLKRIHSHIASVAYPALNAASAAEGTQPATGFVEIGAKPAARH